MALIGVVGRRDVSGLVVRFFCFMFLVLLVRFDALDFEFDLGLDAVGLQLRLDIALVAGLDLQFFAVHFDLELHVDLDVGCIGHPGDS